MGWQYVSYIHKGIILKSKLSFSYKFDFTTKYIFGKSVINLAGWKNFPRGPRVGNIFYVFAKILF